VFLCYSRFVSKEQLGGPLFLLQELLNRQGQSSPLEIGYMLQQIEAQAERMRAVNWAFSFNLRYVSAVHPTKYSVIEFHSLTSWDQQDRILSPIVPLDSYVLMLSDADCVLQFDSRIALIVDCAPEQVQYVTEIMTRIHDGSIQNAVSLMLACIPKRGKIVNVRAASVHYALLCAQRTKNPLDVYSRCQSNLLFTLQSVPAMYDMHMDSTLIPTSSYLSLNCVPHVLIFQALQAYLKDNPHDNRVYVSKDAQCIEINDINDMSQIQIVLTNQQYKPTQAVSNCAKCGTTASWMPRCSGCDSVAYCNPKCQALHWMDHKRICCFDDINLLDNLVPLRDSNWIATICD
jgi:hypothetical protein